MSKFEIISTILGVVTVFILIINTSKITKYISSIWRRFRRSETIDKLRRENTILKNKIIHYETEATRNKDLEVYRGCVYKLKKKDDEFFCMLCLEERDKRIHVTPHGDGWYCDICKITTYPHDLLTHSHKKINS